MCIYYYPGGLTKKNSKSHDHSAEDMVDREPNVTDELSEDDREDLQVIRDILSLIKVSSLQLNGLSSQKNSPNRFFANAIPAIDELLCNLEEL
jgi:hypothetical protein